MRQGFSFINNIADGENYSDSVVCQGRGGWWQSPFWEGIYGNWSRIPWSVAGTFCNLVVDLTTAPGAGNSRTITIQKNLTDTPLTVTISGTATSASDTTHSFTISPGDTLRIKVNSTGTPAAAGNVYYRLEFVGDNARESGYCQRLLGQLINSTVYFSWLPIGDLSANWQDASSIFAVDGAITRYDVLLTDDPGAGKSWNFCVMIDGVAQDGTGGTPDTRVSVADANTTAVWTGTCAVSPGSMVCLRAVPSGGPDFSPFKSSMRYLATTDGESMVAVSCLENLDPNTAQYGYQNGNIGAYSFTESDRQNRGNLTAFVYKKLRCWLNGAPGAGNAYTFTTRLNGADPSGGPVVVIGGSDATGYDPVGAYIVPGATDLFGIQIAPTNGGTLITRDAFWGLVQSTVPPTVLSISPDHGPVAGGTAFTLTGTNFADGATVTFDGLPATSVAFVSDTEITGVTPAHAAGYVDVVVTNPDAQTGTLTNGFRYLTEPTWDPGVDRSGNTIGYKWEEITDADGDLECATDIGAALNDDNYYGHRKHPRIERWGQIERGLSDYRGLYEGATFSSVKTDGDYYYRTQHALLKYAAASVVWRTCSEAARRTGDLARTLVRGIVSQVRPLADRKFEHVCSDVLAQHFGVANDERQIPKRTLSRTQFADLPTDQVGKAEPIIYGEISDEGSPTAPPVLTYDPDEGGFTDGGQINCGFGELLACAADPPTGLSCTTAAGGALSLDVPNGEYGLMAWSVDADGNESDPIPFQPDHANGGARGAFDVGTPHDTVTAGNQQIDASWTVGASATKTRVALGVYYFGWRPLQIIEVAAPGNTCSFDAGAAWPDVPPSPDNITSGATVPAWATYRLYRVTAVMADGETGQSQECMAIVRGYRRPARVRWLEVTGAISYNVYGRSPGFDFDRAWSIEGYEGGDPETYLDDDWLDTEAAIVSGIPAAKGQVPVMYVGTETISGAIWQRFLVCGHAVTEVLGCFQGGVRIDAGCYGATWLVPGQTGWPFAETYRDLGGRRYTLLYVRGPDGEAAVDGSRPITLNVQGIEDVGDGTGDLIETLPEQERHFLQNFGFASWLTGAWLASPTFPADPAPEDTDTVRQIDEDSFDTVAGILAARVAGGGVGAGMFGAGGAFITLREALARFHVSGGYDCGINRKTQYMVSAFDERAASLASPSVMLFEEAREIDAGSFGIETIDAEHFNARKYSHTYDYARGTWGATGERTHDVSIARYKVTKRGPEVQCWFLRSAALAVDLVDRELARTADPPTRVRFSTPAVGFNVELGGQHYVTHSDGIGPAPGWVLQPVRIIRHLGDPSTLGATLTAEDIGDRMLEGT